MRFGNERIKSEVLNTFYVQKTGGWLLKSPKEFLVIPIPDSVMIKQTSNKHCEKIVSGKKQTKTSRPLL
jgi:hypothetical protein